MEIKAISTMQELLALEPEWQRLWLCQKRPQVFQHHAWACAFIASFCPPLTWKVLVARLDGRVIGLLPLSGDEKTSRWRLLGSPNADYQHLLGDASLICDMVTHLAAEGAKMLTLEAMPEGQSVWESLQGCGYPLLPVTEPPTCSYMKLTEASVTAVQRKSGMKDNERRLAKMGPVEIRVIQGADERLVALETLFEQHRLRWDPQGRPSQFNVPATCEFYRRLCTAPALATLLHFSVLQVGGRIIACHMGFVAGDSFIYYKPTYDPAIKGAGQVLMSRLMVEALHMGLKEFDFTRGAEAYKTGLATGARHNHEARLFFSTSAWLRHLGGEWLRHRVPRDADGLAITTRLARQVRSLMGGH